MIFSFGTETLVNPIDTIKVDTCESSNRYCYWFSKYYGISFGPGNHDLFNKELNWGDTLKLSYINTDSSSQKFKDMLIEIDEKYGIKSIVKESFPNSRKQD